jgi:hypothetical protein
MSGIDLDRGTLTKLKIFFTIDGPIASVSVDDICKKAKISRQTFYNHFNSKFDVIPWYATWVESFTIDRIGWDFGWEEGFIRNAYYLQRCSKQLSSGLSMGDSIPMFGSYPVSLRHFDVLSDTIEHHLGKSLTPELKFCLKTFTHMESELAIELYRGSSPIWQSIADTSPLGIAKASVSMIPPLLYTAALPPEMSGYTQLENYHRMDEIDRSIRENATGMDAFIFGP